MLPQCRRRAATADALSASEAAATAPNAGFSCEPPAANGCRGGCPRGEPAALPAAGDCAALCGEDAPLPEPAWLKVLLPVGVACSDTGGGGTQDGSGLPLLRPSTDRRSTKLPVVCTAWRQTSYVQHFPLHDIRGRSPCSCIRTAWVCGKYLQGVGGRCGVSAGAASALRAHSR